MTVVLLATISFVAGVINAVAGGGTFFTFPALTRLGGLTDLAANVTSTVAVWPGALGSAAAARPEFKRLPRGMAAGFFIISSVGATIGAVLLLVTPQRTFSLLVPWLLLFATVIFAFSK